MASKKQSSGDNSTNVQGETVNITNLAASIELSMSEVESFTGANGPVRLFAADIKEIIDVMGAVVESDGEPESQFDFDVISLEKKNELNNLGQEYFDYLVEHHEPYYHKVHDFLENPINAPQREIYYRIVDGIKRQLSVYSGEYKDFAIVLLALERMVVPHLPEHLVPKRGNLPVLISFMYCNCDIGRKADVEG